MRILLVQTGFLGDVILSTPLIPNLRSLYPDSELFLLTTPQAAELVRFHPDIREVLVFDKRASARGLRGLLATAAVLRRYRFDVVFSLHKSFRTAALLALAGVPLRYGFKEAAGSWLYHKLSARVGFEHEVLRNLALLRATGYEPEELQRELSVALPAGALQEAERLLAAYSGRPIAGIAPGSVWATKRWTPQGFAAVARGLHDDGYSVVMVGGPADAPTGELVERSAGVPILNLIGRTSLIVSAGVISKLQLLITNDSAPLHLASAFRTPVVALFCATTPEFGFGPWHTLHETVGVSGLACRPCRAHGGNRCPTGTHACQRELTPMMVVGAARRLVKQLADQRRVPHAEQLRSVP